ncbi:MAG: hypothetical protein AABY86_15545 [Bdellovibrionota bacterium]
MSLSEFLKEKQSQNEDEDEAKEASRKKDFQNKCLLILTQIKEKSEEKYHELSHLFHSRFSSPNIQRKVIMGFYAQLMNEMKALGPAPTLTQTAPKVKQDVATTIIDTQALAQKVEPVKQVKQVKEDKKPVKKEEVKKAAPKAAIKKAPTKKAAPKKASSAGDKKKVTAKKVTKNAGSSVKKKTSAKKK